MVLVPGVPKPITLRDWFAGQALAGFCAHEHIANYEPSRLAEIAYEQADAMLETRKDGDP